MVIINPSTKLLCRTDRPHRPLRNPFRRWIHGISALVLTGIISSCNKSAPVASAGPKPSKDDKKLVVINFDQYFNKDVLKKFTERTGIEVKVVTIESTDELQQMLQQMPEEFDVLVTEESAISDLSERRLLRELDDGLLPHRSNIDPRYLHLACDPENKFSVPYMWGTTLIAYRKDLLTAPPAESAKLLFDPTVNSKISLLDERNECFMMMLLKLGYNPQTATEAQLQEASTILADLVVNHHARFGSDNQMKEHLQKGLSSVAQMYSGDAALISQEDPNIAYFIPEEGATIWVDYFAVLGDTPRVKSAHAFIDFMIEKENAAAGSNLLRYASPNLAAKDLIEPKLLEDRTIYPSEEIRKRCVPIPIWTLEQERVMNVGWKIAKEAAAAYAEAHEQPSTDAPSPGTPSDRPKVGNQPTP